MKLTRLFLIVFALLTTISITTALFSQNHVDDWNNPNYDRIPLELLRKNIIMDYPMMPAVVTSADGYDNFYLGVDFAEPHMSVNPMNPLWFFNGFNAGGTANVMGHGTINGIDWYNTVPNFNSIGFGDPVTAYDSLGNVYFENMTGASSITGTRIVRSTDNGQTWLPSAAGNVGVDKNWIAADQTGGPYANYVYGTMTSGGGTGNFIRSTNYGASFNVTYSFNTQNLPGMMVCVGPKVGSGPDVPGGCVYVVTNSGSTFNPAYSFYMSTDGGLSFTLQSQQYFAGYVGTNVGGRHSVENMRTRPYPFITADNSYGPNRGRLYLVHADNDPPGNGNKPDVWCRYSTDKGVTWSSRVRINDDSNPQANHQWHPAVWCDKQTGRLYVKWLDTRLVPTSDSCDVYASYSDNGGNSFAPNQRITNKTFKIDCSGCGGGGTPRYQGDYDAITSNGISSMMVWTDFRLNSFGSYTAYFPDFAMTLNPLSTILGNNDSAFIRIKVPSVKLYNNKVKFTAAVDTLPASGTLNFSFVGNKDSITTFPDSVTLRVKSIGSVTPGVYGVIIEGRGPNGTPAHQRIQDIYVGVAPVSVGTNREGFCDFKVNGIQYNTRQNLVFNLGSTVTVQAISPKVVGGTRYVFTNWSDNGDTTHNVTVNGPLSLTAYYKTQYKLTIISSIGNTFGGNEFYDSAVAFTFGVNSRIYQTGGQTYQFRGWNGVGNGSYTSPDSSGFDTTVTLSMNNAIVETTRWQNITGISNISSEIPKEYKLYQNFPNPFNPTTTINFDVIHKGIYKISIYDITGRLIEEVLDSELQPGTYKLNYNAGNLASGIYFYRITSNEFNDIKKMILLK